MAQTNQDRKAEALGRKIQKAHDWRVQVWAQSQLRINAAQAELQVLGKEEHALYDPQFDDPDMLRHYAEMSISG